MGLSGVSLDEGLLVDNGGRVGVGICRLVNPGLVIAGGRGRGGNRVEAIGRRLPGHRNWLYFAGNYGWCICST